MSLFVPADSSTDCFALLDDSDASAADPRSRLYSSHIGTLICKSVEQMPAMLQQMQQALQQGQFAVSLFTYELGAAKHGIAPHALASDVTQSPLAEILLFERCEKLSVEQVSAWLAQYESKSPAGIANVDPDISEAAFDNALARIHDYIAAGDTYQVNYTYRLRFDTYGSVHALYRRLRERQPVPYAALIAMPDGRTVLSLSPELLVRHDKGVLTVRPMKGTAAASGNAQQDDVSAHALAADPKNRAENLMIVDLLRNDLGRIAEVGTVTVDKLFDVQRYSSVLQMTSTVHAQLRDGVALPEIFDALYPCGSITGAPKHRTMQIIRELEAHPRGIYTGAIGWFDPPQSTQTVANFCLSVPIRTLQLQAQDELQIRRGEMGVGAGIVHDSVALAEYEECRIKAGFLIDMPAEFELFETIYATRKDGCRHLDRHLQRLRASAEYFGFSFDEVKIRAALRDTCSQFSDTTPYRLRLALNTDGACVIQTAPLSAITSPVKILLAETRTDAGDIFLRHKTTVRASYDTAWRTAEQQGAFDQLFFNQADQLTEGGRSTVFIKLDGRWHTPPLSVGVLPGVMRAVLLEDATLNAKERVLSLTDLQQAEEIMVCNALRGAMPATIIWNK